MWGYYTEQESLKVDPRKFRYLFLRTRLAVEHSTEAFERLGDVWEEAAELLLFPDARGKMKSWLSGEMVEDTAHPGGKTFDDGVVLRLRSNRTPKELSVDLAPALSQFDAWTIFDGFGSCVESSGEGPLTDYLKACASQRSAMLFIEFRDGDHRAEQHIDLLKGKLARARTVFHFRGGRIILVPDQPYRLITVRLGSIVNSFRGFACIDTEGEAHVSRNNPDDLWEHQASLYDLAFGEDVLLSGTG